MGVKYLHRADTGATVTDGSDPSTGFDPSTFADSAAATQLLNKVKAFQILSQLRRPAPAQLPPTGDVLQEQRLRSEGLADSMSPGTQFYPGLEHGGLFDAISSFGGQVGLGRFGLSEGARTVNRTPLDSLGGGMDDAIRESNDISRNAAQAPGIEPPADLGGAQDSLIQELMSYIKGDSKDKAGAPGSTGSVSLNGHYHKGPPEGTRALNGLGYQGNSPFDEAAPAESDTRHADFLKALFGEQKAARDMGGGPLSVLGNILHAIGGNGWQPPTPTR